MKTRSLRVSKQALLSQMADARKLDQGRAKELKRKEGGRGKPFVLSQAG